MTVRLQGYVRNVMKYREPVYGRRKALNTSKAIYKKEINGCSRRRRAVKIIGHLSN